MNTNALSALYLPTQEACARTEFYSARLMTPQEVSAATHNHPAHEQVALDAVWALCGDLKESSFEVFQRHREVQIASRFSVFTSNFGDTYLVTTHQTEGHQHRFLLPLYDRLCREFVHALDEQPFCYSLGQGGQNLAMVIPGHPLGFYARDLRVFCKDSGQNSLAEHFERFAAAVLTVGGVAAIPSLLQDEHVTDVSVSFVLPEALHSPGQLNASFH